MSFDGLLEKGIENVVGVPAGVERVLSAHALRLLEEVSRCNSQAVNTEDLNALIIGLQNSDPTSTLLDRMLQIISKAISKAQVKSEYPVATFLASTFPSDDPRCQMLYFVQGVVLAIAYSLSKDEEYNGVYQRAMNSLRLTVERIDKPQYRASHADFLETLPDFSLDAESIYVGLERLWSKDASSKNLYGPLKVLFHKYITGKKPAKRGRRAGLRHLSGPMPFVSVRNLSTTSINDDWVEVKEYAANTIIASAPDSAQEQMADEGMERRQLEVKMVAPESVQRSLMLKQRQAKAVVNQLVRREKQLPTEWLQLTQFEVSTLLKGCLEHFNSAEHRGYSYSYLMLMICTGRSLSLLYLMVHDPDARSQKFITSPAGEWCIRIESQLPEHSVIEKLEPVLTRSQSHFVLMLPDVLQQCIQTIQKDRRSFDRSLAGVDKVIGSLLPETFSRVSKDRICRYIGFWLSGQRLDSIEINWLLGVEQTVFEAGMFYAQVPIVRLQANYNKCIDHLFTLADEVRGNEAAVWQQGHIGSQLQLEEIRVTRLFNALYRQIDIMAQDGSVQWETFHNAYTLYTVLLLNFSSGHRPTINPYQSLKFFDRFNGTLFIEDKAIGGSKYGRQLVLPDVAIEQLNCYTDYIQQIAAQIAYVDSSAERMFNCVAGSELPLFFFVDSGIARTLAPGLMVEKMQHILPLPQNIHRHFMRTKIREQGVMPDIVSAWMGHAYFGHEAFEKFSGMALADLRHAAVVIDGYLRNVLGARSVCVSRRFTMLGVTHLLISENPVRVSSQRKQRREQSISESVNKLIRRHLTGLNLRVPNTANYESGKNTVLLQIEKRFTKFNDYRRARNYFSVFINSGNRDGKWSLPVPEHIVTLKQSKPFRSAQWFSKVTYLTRWRGNWLTELGALASESRQLPLSDLLASCLISAMVHGGLCLPEAVTALRKVLISSRKPLSVHGDIIWLELKFESASQAINDESEKTLRRWFPDTVSLALICQLLKRLKTARKIDVNALTAIDTWSLIRNYSVNISAISKFEFSSLGQLSTAAIGVVENLPGVRLPQALVEYCVGNQASASLPLDHWLSLLQSPEYQAVVVSFADFKTFSIEKKSTSSGGSSSPNYEALIKSIRVSLRSKGENGKKISGKLAARAIKTVIQSETWALNVYLLLDWLYTLLQRDRLQVSSVSRYFSAVGKGWLAETAGLSMEDWDVSDFEALYESILELAKTDKTRHYNARRLVELHRHGVSLAGLPPVTAIEGVEAGNIRPRVRAGVVSEGLLQACLGSIDQLGDLVEHSRNAICCLVTICYRTGLRLGEVLKIRLCDVERSDEYWLFIRNNRYGNNKSLSSRRKIPLALLLTVDELQAFKAYLSRQQAIAKDNFSALLFSESQSALVPMDSHQVSRLVGYLLTTISGQKMVFHHLRHSAITYFFCLLDAHLHRAGMITGYKEEQIEAIRQFFLQPKKDSVNKDVYWVIAGLAGHTTPATTFNNYIHLVDLAVGRSLKQCESEYPEPVIKGITGWSNHRMGQLVKVKGKIPSSLAIADIISLVMDNAAGYSIRPMLKAVKHKNLEISRRRRIGLGIDLYYDVLKAIEGGASVAEAADQFAVAPDLVQRWRDNAEVLADLKTRASSLRLIAAGRKPAPAGKILVPPKPRTAVERRQADKALTQLRRLYPKQKKEIQWCVRYYIERTNTSKAGIPFKHLEDVIRFVGVMSQIDSPSNWVLKVFANNKDQFTTLMTLLDKTSLPKSSFLFEKNSSDTARYRLYWKKPGLKKGSRSLVYSSSVPRYLLFMLAISLADSIDIQSLIRRPVGNK